jgi:hypothetical protein
MVSMADANNPVIASGVLGNDMEQRQKETEE